MKQVTVTKKRSLAKRIIRLVLKSILFLVVFFLVIVLLILTPPVQNFLRKKAVAYLENKLHTKVVVGRIFIGLPKKIVIEDVYVEDRQKDTLLSAGSLKVDVGLWKLIFDGDININRVELKNSTVKIKRQFPDTTFNFQFIADAFSSPASKEKNEKKDTASPALVIRVVEMDKIRFVYKDVVTGNDVETWLDHFDTKIDKVDLSKSHFDVPRISVSGLIAKVRQVKPLAQPEPMMKDIKEANEPPNLRLDLKKINLDKIQLDYRNDASALYINVNLDKTAVEVNEIDLTNQFIDLEEISMANMNVGLRLGKKEEAEAVVKETKQEIEARRKTGWRIIASSIRLDNNNLSFENDNAPVQETGMDYAHLKADALTLHANDFIFSEDSIGGEIEKATFKEKSGFVLNELKTRFLYASDQSYLRGLYLKTPGTELKREAAIQYYSFAAMKNNIGSLGLDADINNSKVLVNDLLTFVPALRQQPAFADPSVTWYINSRIRGRLSDLQIDALEIQGLQDTKIDLGGRLTGFPDIKNLAVNLDIRNISSSKRDIDLFVPAGTLPQNITLPARLNVTGKARGNANELNAGVSINTDLGNMTINGKFERLNDPKNIKYNASVQTTSLALGTILQQEETFGAATAIFTANGKGTDPETAEGTFSVKIESAVFKQYNYQNFNLEGSIAMQQLKANASIIDPNIHFAIKAEADISKNYPSVFVNGMIDSIKFQPLHLTDHSAVYRGKIGADFPVTDPENLQGKLFITESLLVRQEQRLKMDTVKLIAGDNDSGHYISLNSDIVNAELSGKYKITELGTIFQQSIQPYFKVQPAGSVTNLSYDFRLNAYITNSPALKTIVPELERLDSISFQSRFSDKHGWSALLVAPVADIGDNHIRRLRLEAGTGKDQLDVKAAIQQFRSGKSIQLDNTTITASLANNTIDFVLNIRDRSSKDKYNLEGTIQQPRTGNYTISLKSNNLLLNYNSWDISAGNKLIISGKNVNASGFVLNRSGQELMITSQSQNANAPMEIEFSDFRLATLTGFVQTDSTFADGTINGKLTIIDMTSNPVFTGDLTIHELRLKNDTAGNVHLVMNNKVSDAYFADITITGRGNDVRLNGNYYPKSSSGNFDFTLDIKQMPLATVQAFSDGGIRNSSGSVNGKFTVKGTMDKPAIHGDLNFDKATFIFNMLNSHFSIDQEKLAINSEGIQFNDFAIKDSAGNQLQINGTAATTDFSHYKFDMNVRANNFRALNSSKKDNRIFYGRLYFNTNMTIKGTEELPIVDGRLKVNEKTKMTIVLPQREPGVTEREGVVQFVDMDAPLNDSLFLVSYDSLNITGFRGMDISMTIEVDKEADFTLIIDEGNGDFLNVQGEALLTASVDRSGQMILSGTYELESGSYELSFNFLRRKFAIQKGSKITWEGEPTKATVDVIAKYIANVAPLDLVKSQLGEDITITQRNTYLQKLPFDVMLRMEGPLMQPKISFDIILPDNKSYIVSNDIITNVRTKLDQLRQEEGEMNKQVFSLLLLNRFVAENPFVSSTGTSVSTLARQSVSKLMTEQLNQLAAELVKGVDINFDIQSSEDYTTGERRDRTDLNVGLSKRLLDDRLTVTVGSNFELEGPQNSSQQSNNIAANVALDYKLSKDGRYLLRAYRKNEYEGVIDGYVVETGVGFIITVDYNRFREIFQSQKKRQEERRKRREAEMKEEEKNKQQSSQTEPADKNG